MIFLERIGKALPCEMKKEDLLQNLEAIYGR